MHLRCTPAAADPAAPRLPPHRPPARSYQRHGADFCNCPDDNTPACGTDQQTYLNECVMRCAGAIKLKVRRGGDWAGQREWHGMAWFCLSLVRCWLTSLHTPAVGAKACC